MSIRLLRFNLQKEIIEEEEVINSAIPFKDLTDYLNKGYLYNTPWNTFINLSNASRMEGSIILDKDNKIVRVPTTPEVYEIQVKLVKSNDVMRLMFKKDINDDESWSLLSGKSYETTDNELEGSHLSIKSGWRYRFVPVDGDPLVIDGNSDPEDFRFNFSGLNHGHSNLTSSGNLGDKSVAYTESGIGSGFFRWNLDGTVHEESTSYIEFAVDHYCSNFDENDPTGCIYNQQIVGIVTPAQKIYNIMVWNPQKIMIDDVEYVEDYTEGNRPFSLSNEIGVISDRRFTGESGLSWTNYLLKSLDIVADSITSDSTVTMTAIEGEGSTSDGSFDITPVWDGDGHGNINITGANIVIDGTNEDLLGPITLSPASHTFSQGSTDTKSFTISYADDTAPYLISNGEETFTGNVSISYSVTDPESSNNILSKVYNLPMSVVVGNLEAELSVGASTSTFLTAGEQHDQGNTTSSSRDYPYYLTNRSVDDTITIESVAITNNTFNQNVLVGYPDYSTSLVGLEIEGQDQKICRVYSVNNETSDSDSATITITYNSISNSTSRTMSWGITWYRQSSGYWVYSGGITMDTPTWTADEGDGGSNEIITLTNDYRKWWSTSSSTITYLATTAYEGTGDSDFTISGNSGNIAADGTKSVTVGWNTSLAVGNYSLTKEEVFSTVGNVSRSGGPASLTINEAEVTYDTDGTLSMSWSYPDPENTSTRYRSGTKWYYTASEASTLIGAVVKNDQSEVRLVTLHGSQRTLQGGELWTYLNTSFAAMDGNFPQTRSYHFRDGVSGNDAGVGGNSAVKTLTFSTPGTSQQVANVSNDASCDSPINIAQGSHTGTATISNTHADQYFTGGSYTINTPTQATHQLSQGYAASVGSKSTSWGLGVKAYGMQYGSSYTISGAGLSDVTVNCQHRWSDATAFTCNITGSSTVSVSVSAAVNGNINISASAFTVNAAMAWTMAHNWSPTQVGIDQISITFAAIKTGDSQGWNPSYSASPSGGDDLFGSSGTKTFNVGSAGNQYITGISDGDKVGVRAIVKGTPFGTDGENLISDNEHTFHQDLWIYQFTS